MSTYYEYYYHNCVPKANLTLLFFSLFSTVYVNNYLFLILGSILVFISLPFAFSPPVLPQFETSELNTAMYYCFFIIIFQIGWASIENSHMTLASDLTLVRDERTALLSIRYL